MQVAHLVILDEMPMQYCRYPKALDWTFKDICDNPSSFGGIILVFGGNFRQILSVVP